jgi:hypothetical protein
MTRMTTQDLKKVFREATPGPWRWVSGGWRDGHRGIDGGDGSPVLRLSSANEGDTGDAWIGTEDVSDPDAALLAAAPILAAEVIELRTIRDVAMAVGSEMSAEMDQLRARISELEGERSLRRIIQTRPQADATLTLEVRRLHRLLRAVARKAYALSAEDLPEAVDFSAADRIVDKLFRDVLEGVAESEGTRKGESDV